MKFRYLPHLALVLAFSFLVPPSVQAGSPLCGRNPDPRYTDNNNPIARIGVAVKGSSGEQRSATIPIGGSVVLDATPRDGTSDRGNPTNGTGEPVWDIPGTAAERDTRGTNCFTPTIIGKANSVLEITVTQDGVTSNVFKLTIGAGGPTQGGGTGKSAPPGDLAEDQKLCAIVYNDTKKGFLCIGGTENEDCLQVDQCIDAEKRKEGKCQKKTQEECSTKGANQGFGAAGIAPRTQPRDFGQLIQGVFNWSIRFVGIAVFVMLVYGGFTWLVAGGSPGKITQAKGTIRDAVWGAILLLSAYLILNTINPDFVDQRLLLQPPAQEKKNTTPNNPLPVAGSGVLGSTCNRNNDCRDELVCGPGFCQKPNPVLGDPCKVSEDCTYPLICDQDKKQTIEGNQFGTCATPSPTP